MGNDAMKDAQCVEEKPVNIVLDSIADGDAECEK
jgi:hypothetical protein